MKGIHFLLIDDHALVRKGLRLLLLERHPETVVSEAGSLETALNLQIAPPDVILLDVKLPGVRGIDGIAPLKSAWPDAKIIMVSSLDASEAVAEATACGAAGYISKGDSPDRILQQIDATAESTFNQSNMDSMAPALYLTVRQLDILKLLCQGLSNKLIARQLSLSENTVRHHVQDILAYFHAESRSEAAFAARRRGYVE